MTEQWASRGDAAALEIYQRFADDMSSALADRRYTEAAALFNLPVQVRTRSGDVVLELPEEVADGYRVVFDRLHAGGLTDVLWLAFHARWLSPGYVEGIHVSHYLRHANAIVPPFRTRMVLRDVAGRWLLDEAETAARKPIWPIEILDVQADADIRWDSDRFPREDARTSVFDPLTVYQRFLDAYSLCNMTGDFEAAARMHLFPYTVHTNTMDKTVKAPEGLRDFFDRIGDVIRKHGVDRFERKATRAEFLSASKICGYHTGALYRGDTLVVGPIQSRFILQRVGPDWFIRSITNAVANATYPFAEPELSPEMIGLRAIQERRDT